MKYKNGNALITLESNGTRVISFEGELNLEYPLNLDIRVNTSCSFANSICKDFCHESAIINGKEANYEELKKKLLGLPKGIELAIGCNEFTKNLEEFLWWCKNQGYISNLTVNQGHLKRDYQRIKNGIDNKIINGLGISYRNSLKFYDFFNDYENTIYHVIIGIDNIKDIIELKNKGVKKILCLGWKDFGYNKGKVNLEDKNFKLWYWWIYKLFSLFDVVSFDNLALEQLNLKRFFTQEEWDRFYNFEHSFYIDAVNQTFAPSSRSNKKVYWNYTIKEYYGQL